jgi:hypothetical protein
MKSFCLIKIVVGITIIILASFVRPALALAQTPDRPAPDFFIEAEINNPTPFLGQQIIYTLSRYQAVDFPKPPYYEDHPFVGFWHTFLIQRPPYTTTIDGREYRVHQTHIALFPTRPGALMIDPARLVIPRNRPERDTILESHAIPLYVQPLPGAPPPTFKGAVGQFEISARLNASEGKVDQVMSLIVEIKGAGNLETLVGPSLPDLPDWRSRETEITTDVPLLKDVVKGSRQFIWSVVPGKAGEQEIPPIDFSYFNPQDNTYHTIRTEPILVTILHDETKPSTPVSASPPIKQAVKLLGEDIRHIKPAPTGLNTGSIADQTYGLIYLICSILPLLAMGGVWGWRRRRQHWLAATPQARRRQAIYKAKRLLASAQQPHADFMMLIRQTLLGYLADKLDQPTTGLTSDRLADLLEAAKLDPGLIGRIQTLLGQVESSRFAPVTGDQTLTRSLLADTQALIEDLEQFFRRL